MREIRIGKPTITSEGRRMVETALNEGRISEGLYTRLLEQSIAERLGVKHAILVNSGHSALVIAYQAGKALRGIDKIVTTSMTFISTVSAALEAGLKVDCLDIADDLQIDRKKLISYFDNNRGSEIAYVPVHLFGYPCTELGPRGVFQIDDACEAFGSKRADTGQHLGTEGDIGCFSFYTSHVMGAGELGCIVTNHHDLDNYMRRAKDQGRAQLRPTNHIEQMTSVDPADRYHHSILGWNFRTTDLQAALVLGAMPHLGEILLRRRGVVSNLSYYLEKYHLKRLHLPDWNADVSYLGYPIVCDTVETRNLLMFGLDRRRIETRPLMSYLPEEKALENKIHLPEDPKYARDIHARGLYISCHDSMADEDIKYIVKSFNEVLK